MDHVSFLDLFVSSLWLCLHHLRSEVRPSHPHPSHSHSSFFLSIFLRRLKRGLEQTFEIRKRVLTNGFFTCCVYTSWSVISSCMFAITNSSKSREKLGDDGFEDLLSLNAFFHSARGALNIIVWIVINAPVLADIVLASSSKSPYSLIPHPPPLTENSYSESKHELDTLLKPELNTALRKQMIRMATSGIVESVQHYHRLHQRILSNQTFHLDWQRSPSANFRESQLDIDAIDQDRSIQIVDIQNEPSIPRFSFLPMSMKEMQFYDFQPRIFASIRHLYAIEDSEYIVAFRKTINERISEGRSGAFIFNSCDRKYTVKSLTAQEKTVLLDLLPSLVRYTKWNPTTLLPRFFGLHAMKMYGQIFYFVVMGNILYTSEIIHRRYDIKGSWVDRNAPACLLGEKYRCSKCNRFFRFGNTNQDTASCTSPNEDHFPDVTLRDNDLKKRLKLDSEVAMHLYKQIARDTNFLSSMGIMDYSLLIGVHYSRYRISTAEDKFGLHSAFAPNDSLPSRQHPLSKRLCDPQFDPIRRFNANEVSGPSVYYLGLIDILQKWTIGKRMERAYKLLVLRKDGRGVSAMHPKPYAIRFQQKLHQLLSTRTQA